VWVKKMSQHKATQSRERRVAQAVEAAQQRAEKRSSEKQYAPGKAVVWDVILRRKQRHNTAGGSKLAAECQQVLGALSHMSNAELRELKERGVNTVHVVEAAPELEAAEEGTPVAEVERLSLLLLREQAATKELNNLCAELEQAAVKHGTELANLESTHHAGLGAAEALQVQVEELEQQVSQRGGNCTQCRNNAATVVALPCQHMCLCEACHIRMITTSGVGACLVCGTIMADSITVKFR